MAALKVTQLGNVCGCVRNVYCVVTSVCIWCSFECLCGHLSVCVDDRLNVCVDI